MLKEIALLKFGQNNHYCILGMRTAIVHFFLGSLRVWFLVEPFIGFMLVLKECCKLCPLIENESNVNKLDFQQLLWKNKHDDKQEIRREGLRFWWLLKNQCLLCIFHPFCFFQNLILHGKTMVFIDATNKVGKKWGQIMLACWKKSCTINHAQLCFGTHNLCL